MLGAPVCTCLVLSPVVIDSSVLAPVVNNMYIMEELLSALVWSVK